MKETSSLQWKFMEDTNEAVTRKQKRMWNEFLKWLITKPMRTNVDFKPQAWRQKISTDRKCLTTRYDERKTKSCETSENGKHNEVDEVPDEIDLCGSIGILNK